MEVNQDTSSDINSSNDESTILGITDKLDDGSIVDDILAETIGEFFDQKVLEVVGIEDDSSVPLSIVVSQVKEETVNNTVITTDKHVEEGNKRRNYA